MNLIPFGGCAAAALQMETNADRKVEQSSNYWDPIKNVSH